MNREDATEWTESLGQSFSGNWRQTKLAVKLGVPKALGLTTEQWVRNLGGCARVAAGGPRGWMDEPSGDAKQTPGKRPEKRRANTKNTPNERP